MSRLTLETDAKFDETLNDLATGGMTKADVLRRAVASYQTQTQTQTQASTGEGVGTETGQGEAEAGGAAARGMTFGPRTVAAADVGSVEMAPPSFLERWGVVFLACFGGWILVTGTVILVYFLWKQPAMPNLSGLTPEQIRDALAAHKQMGDQWRDGLNYIFDLLITKTALPLVTLLLGYLFGKGKGDSV